MKNLADVPATVLYHAIALGPVHGTESFRERNPVIATETSIAQNEKSETAPGTGGTSRPLGGTIADDLVHHLLDALDHALGVPGIRIGEDATGIDLLQRARVGAGPGRWRGRNARKR